MPNSKTQERTHAEWEWEATKIMFKLKDDYESFSADDFFALAREVSMPAPEIKKLVGSSFKAYQSAGYIAKTKEFRLSTRNGSSPLPVWKGIKQSKEQLPSEIESADK